MCKNKRSLKLYYENEGKISNQQKIYYEKSTDNLLQKQNNRYKKYKELFRTYVE